jgi:hypothetical protein
MDKIKMKNRGSFIIEGILVVVVVIAIAGACLWTYNNRTVKVVNNTKAAISSGTTSSIDQLTQQDSQDESTINTKYDSFDQSVVTATNKSQSDLGGSYDESSF